MIADRPLYESYADQTQWLEIRKTGWGSSDAGPALGISRHKTNVVATLEKQGKLEPEDLSQNPYIKRGKRLEPVVAEMVEEELGIKLQRVNRVRRHREYPMLASIDRAIVGTRFKRIVEIKTASIFTAHEYGESGTDEVPSDVYAQAVTQNIVYDADEVIVAALFGLDDLRFTRSSATPRPRRSSSTG